MVLVVVLGLEVHGHWIQFGSVGNGVGIVVVLVVQKEVIAIIGMLTLLMLTKIVVYESLC